MNDKVQAARDAFEENRRIARGNAVHLNKALEDVFVPVIRALFDLLAEQQTQIEALTPTAPTDPLQRRLAQLRALQTELSAEVERIPTDDHETAFRMMTALDFIGSAAFHHERLIEWNAKRAAEDGPGGGA